MNLIYWAALLKLKWWIEEQQRLLDLYKKLIKQKAKYAKEADKL